MDATGPDVQKAVTRALLIVVAAPSGAGKTTLCDRLLEEFPQVTYSVSCTTRPPRGKEVDGIDYHFLSPDEFERRVQAGEFLEYADVYGYRYGTLRQTVEAALREGRSVLMDLDVQGAARLRRGVRQAADGDLLKTGFLDIFIEPPSLDVLRERLANRAEDSAESIDRRFQNAQNEMSHRHEFHFRIVNGDVNVAYGQMREIVLRAMRGE
ncbi:MAG: guanylate kinase [Lentisphaerae bacterium]|nr:guanylate kinase [Lentisphaerota bacterium]